MHQTFRRLAYSFGQLMDDCERRVRSSRLNTAEISSEQSSFFRKVFLRHAFGVSQLFETQTKLALDKVVLIVFHDNRYQFCALIHTHTNSYISELPLNF